MLTVSGSTDFRLISNIIKPVHLDLDYLKKSHIKKENLSHSLDGFILHWYTLAFMPTLLISVPFEFLSQERHKCSLSQKIFQHV